jgi:hypothetical protein
MTFKADLKFNDSKNVYTVIECDYEFTQETDRHDKPSSIPRFGRINVTIESMSDPAMVQWAAGTTNVRSGSITFYKDDTATAKLKSLNFEGAICIRLNERFASYGESPMMTQISFVVEKVTLDTVNSKALWTNF